MDILEQLESKVLDAIYALETLRSERDTLTKELEEGCEELAQLRMKLADADTQLFEAAERLEHRDTALTALQQQLESAKKDNVRLAHEKSEQDAKLAALLEAIEQSVTA